MVIIKARYWIKAKNIWIFQISAYSPEISAQHCWAAGKNLESWPPLPLCPFWRACPVNGWTSPCKSVIRNENLWMTAADVHKYRVRWPLNHKWHALPNNRYWMICNSFIIHEQYIIWHYYINLFNEKIWRYHNWQLKREMTSMLNPIIHL